MHTIPATVLAAVALGAGAGGVPNECQCLADIAVDGVVDVADLLFVINTWGPCPE